MIRLFYERPGGQRMAELLVLLGEREWARQAMVEELQEAQGVTPDSSLRRDPERGTRVRLNEKEGVRLVGRLRRTVGGAP